MHLIRRLSALLTLLLACSASSGLARADTHCSGGAAHQMASMDHHSHGAPAPHSNSCDHCPPAECASAVACGGASQGVPTFSFATRIAIAERALFHPTSLFTPTPPLDPPVRPPSLA